MSGVPPTIPIGEVEWFVKKSNAQELEDKLNEISNCGWTVFSINTLTHMVYDNWCYQIVSYKYNAWKEDKK